MKPAAVVFDIDGMLNRCERFSARFSRAYGVRLERMHPFFAGPFAQCIIGNADLRVELERVIPEWGYAGTVDDVLTFWLEGEVCADEQMFDLARVVSKQVPCVVATNQERYRTEFLEERLRLGDLFENVYSSARVGFKKPQPEFFLPIVVDYGHRADRIVFWDDDQENVDGASALGFRAYRFTSAVDFMQRMESFGFRF